jgi:hypothetical protein
MILSNDLIIDAYIKLRHKTRYLNYLDKNVEQIPDLETRISKFSETNSSDLMNVIIIDIVPSQEREKERIPRLSATLRYRVQGCQIQI